MFRVDLLRRLSPLYAAIEHRRQRLLFDRRYGLPDAASSRRVRLSDFGHDAPGRRDYSGSSSDILRRILRNTDVGPDDVFVDIGCGMGRVAIAAARYPFKRVIGVDIVPEFTAVARDAIARNKHRLRCRQVEFVTADAARWPLPDDVTVVYLFDPFYGDVLHAVVAQLFASIERRPRSLRVIYNAPSELHPFEEIPSARLIRYGRRAIRRWASAEYLRLYEIQPTTLATSSGFDRRSAT